MSSRSILDSIQERIDLLTRHLENSSSCVLDEQRHLDPETVESAYWHAGYRAALIDVAALLRNAIPVDRKRDKESGCLSVARDGAHLH